MSQGEWFTTYLQYENLKEMLNVILYTSQSFMTITPLLYHLTYNGKDVLFIHTGIVGGVVAHYNVIEINKMTSDFKFVEKIGHNPQSIYIPIVKLVKSTLVFPIDGQPN